MRSQLDVRLGAQEPQILHLPPDVVSLAAAEEAIELADAYGVCDGIRWTSRRRSRCGCARRTADGSWAATRSRTSARQNGKNDKIAARELAGLILFGERLIIHTAHEFPTANESFLRLVAVFENWDDLRKKVARIRYANGEQGIELLSGQRLKYRARTGGSGRGFAKADLVVYDEAQHLSGASTSPRRSRRSWRTRTARPGTPGRRAVDVEGGVGDPARRDPRYRRSARVHGDDRRDDLVIDRTIRSSPPPLIPIDVDPDRMSTPGIGDARPRPVGHRRRRARAVRRARPGTVRP
jgi:hypothetical protein